MGIVGLWLAAGFLLDSWAHLHIAIETFFTPYHAIFYSAMVAGALILAVFARRNFALGFTGFDMLPAAYQSALWGVPIFFAGGVGDLIWHTFFGVEDRVEAVTSPTHLIIGVGVLLVAGAPIRSALSAARRLTTLRAQLPLLFALATWLEFIHLGTAYAFDPGAAMIYAPPDGVAYGPDYFTNTTFVLFKTGSGIAIVILQSLMLMGVCVWTVDAFQVGAGGVDDPLRARQRNDRRDADQRHADPRDVPGDERRRGLHRRCARGSAPSLAGTTGRVRPVRRARAGRVLRNVFSCHRAHRRHLVELDPHARRHRLVDALRLGAYAAGRRPQRAAHRVFVGK